MKKYIYILIVSFALGSCGAEGLLMRVQKTQI